MKKIVLELDDKIYEEILKKAKEEGFSTVVEYINLLILKSIERKNHKKISEDVTKRSLILSKITTLIERKVQDSVNPFTQKVDDLGRKVAELIEKIEVLEEKLTKLEETKKMIEIKQEEPKKEKKIRKSAIDILKEQKIMFEKDLVNKIRDRDSFFAKLEREGAVIIEAKDERIAVDPLFWSNFANKLKSIKTNNDEELKKILNPQEFKFLQKLRESALIVYDGSSKSWNLLI